MKRSDRRRGICGLAAALALCLLLACSGCGAAAQSDGTIPVVGDLTYESTVPLAYADQFTIYRYQGGYSLVDIIGSGRILVVPEGKPVPEGLDGDIVAVQQPLHGVYLAATSAMALFEAVDALDSIAFVGSREWYTDSAVQGLESGRFVYAGKYNAPDYELLLGGGCQLAIESTMILHNPEVKEKLTELGIPVIVERSSYEDHPLGRTEWVKVYGALLGREAEAEAAFSGEMEKVVSLESLEPTGKSVAFFYINSAGNAVTYKGEGYVPAMIRIAGGEYVLSDRRQEDDSKLSTINMNMEEFYSAAREADIVIYSCSIASQLHSLAEFLDLSPVLEDFKAVREDNVWCTTQSMFQQTDKMGTIIQEINAVLTGAAEEQPLDYLFKLQ